MLCRDASELPFCTYYGPSTRLYHIPVNSVISQKTWTCMVDSSWNVMAHGDARERKWRGNWRMEWVASTLHTISEHGVSSVTTADAHTSAARGRLNWRPRRFKWTRPFRRKMKSGFCACAITFQPASTTRSGSTRSKRVVTTANQQLSSPYAIK